MRILGIDPGSKATGFGIVDLIEGRLFHVHHGIIQPKRGDFPSKLLNIHEKAASLLEDFKPDTLIIEKTFYSKNFQSALKLGQVRGIVILAAAQRGVPIFEYTPAEIKKALTGSGRADKTQVCKMVSALLGIEDTLSPDASDALAIAICHAHAVPFLEKIETLPT